MPLDLTRAHPPRIHRDDLVIKAGEAAPLGYDLRLEAGVALPRGLQLQFSEVPLQGFPASLIAAEAAVVPRRIVLLKSRVVHELGL